MPRARSMSKTASRTVAIVSPPVGAGGGLRSAARAARDARRHDAQVAAPVDRNRVEVPAVVLAVAVVLGPPGLESVPHPRPGTEARVGAGGVELEPPPPPPGGAPPQ